MEPKRLRAPDDGHDGGVGHAPGADGHKGVRQQTKIGKQLGRALISPGSASQPPALRIYALDRQLREHQADESPPGFLRLIVDRRLLTVSRFFKQTKDAVAQGGRRRLQTIGQAR